MYIDSMKAAVVGKIYEYLSHLSGPQARLKLNSDILLSYMYVYTDTVVWSLWIYFMTM